MERPARAMVVKASGLVAAIDVGTTKICTLIGDLDPTGRVRVLGAGIVRSEGMRRGAIDSMAEVTAAIRRSIEDAERAAGGVEISSATVGLAGGQTGCINTKGLTAIANPNRPIGAEDIERALDSARTIAIPTNREVVHVLARHYLVDGSDQVSNPLGMYGHRLDVEAHVVTAGVNGMQNLKRCVTNAGAGIDQLVLQQLASAEAVLDPEERRYGVILADIGGGATDIVVLLNDAVYHTAVIPLGGDSISQDLVVGMRAPFRAAEYVKETYGHAIPSAVHPDETIEIDAFGAEPRRSVNRRRVCEIIQARMEEILEYIEQDVQRAGLNEIVAAGLVLTGGAANLEGVERLAADVLGMPVRVAYPKDVVSSADFLVNPAFATSIGLLSWAARENGLQPADSFENGQPKPPRVANGDALGGLMRKIQVALRTLLP